eukprot:scaffold155886_cov45-Prasinocladus_malaysianus.AAC.1
MPDGKSSQMDKIAGNDCVGELLAEFAMSLIVNDRGRGTHRTPAGGARGAANKRTPRTPPGPGVRRSL